MPYRLTPLDMEQLLSLSSEERYRHFIDKVADWEELWGVYDDQGWLVQATSEQRHYVTLWPHPLLTEDAIKRHLPNGRAEEIDFELLLEHWLPMLEQQGIHISVLPNRDWHAMLVTAEQFESDLRAAMKAYQ